jgi:hypothetical protein
MRTPEVVQKVGTSYRVADYFARLFGPDRDRGFKELREWTTVQAVALKTFVWLSYHANGAKAMAIQVVLAAKRFRPEDVLILEAGQGPMRYRVWLGGSERVPDQVAGAAAYVALPVGRWAEEVER